MIIINKKGEVIYPIDFNKLLGIILLPLIRKRAYKGYAYYNTIEDENAQYLSFEEFCKFEDWKIKFSFQIYLERLKKIKHLGLNPSNKTLLKYIFK